MQPPADETRLLTAAASVSDGTEVDWNDLLQEASTDEEAAVVAQLRVLAGVASAHAGQRAWGSLAIVDVLGQGAFGTVYRAWDPALERDVALKIIQPGDGHQFEPEQAVSEARRLARVRHPNVVSVFGAERRGEDVGIEMELVRGLTLHAIVTSRGPLSATEATLIGIDLCGALAAVHSAGLLHGDIKAQNVMRAEGGRIVLMDLGASRDLMPGRPPSGNDFAGTPLYVAPEVFRGADRSPASDFYSLGVLLFFLTTGSYPVEGDTRSQVGLKHRTQGRSRRLRDVRPDLPKAFVAVVERALAETPELRYQSAGAFEAALRDALSVGRAAVFASIRPLLLAAAGLAAVGTLGGVAYWNSAGAPASDTAGLTASAATVASAPPAPSDTPYFVEAALYRATPGGGARLDSGATLQPGDELYLQVEVSVPAYAYVVNEDEQGMNVLLFPLRGQPAANPLAAGRVHRLPGTRGGQEYNWQVSTEGGREHFLVWVTPERIPALEESFADLPVPVEGMPYAPPPLPNGMASMLRSIGGLVRAGRANQSAARLSDQITEILSGRREESRGVWSRKAVFLNPER